MERPLRIGLVAPPWVEVPPPKYGGTESVLDTLARGLVARGHRVTLYTVGDSTCPVDRAWVNEHAVTPMGSTVAELFQVTAAYEALSDCDVIHDHTDAGPLWAGGRSGMPPIVATNHNAFTRERSALYATAARLGVSVVAISEHHRATAQGVPDVQVVHNGIDVDRFPVGPGTGGYAVFVGRFSPAKGPAEAIAIARAAGVPLHLAGKMRDPDEQEYFQRFVEPELDDDIVYLGEIGAEQRDRELGGAVALVNPIQWDEPFGLAMVESMACGTPVVAFPNGAAPEIVRDGVNGYLVDDVDSGAAALAAISRLDRSTCRADVEERFSAEHMVRAYEEVYRRAVG